MATGLETYCHFLHTVHYYVILEFWALEMYHFFQLVICLKMLKGTNLINLANNIDLWISGVISILQVLYMVIFV